MSNTIPTILEYIWIGGNGELRSKTKILYSHVSSISDIPPWNYDGSSTGQADIHLGNTEVIIKPCKYYKNPLYFSTTQPTPLAYLVLCDTWLIDGTPHPTNTRYKAADLAFGQNNQNCQETLPWFGLEQEYYMASKHDIANIATRNLSKIFYCGTSNGKIQRAIVEEHMFACIAAGLTISGTNAEVAPKQWEFQIGPCLGINSGDELYVARFLLERIAEKYEVVISYAPKPYPELSGSGCHTNFSTKATRESGGLDEIYKYISNLELRHLDHMLVYGLNNNKRLTGLHETAPYGQFSYGVGTRNTSIRIPNDTSKMGCGYFEDRRPAANMDPYLVTMTIYTTCLLWKP